MRFKAVIFDLDGTLLDTLDDIGTAANSVLAQFQQPIHPMETYKTLVGDGVAVLFQRAWPATKTDPQLLEQAVLAFQSAYAVQWNNRSKPYDGIEILLNQLSTASMTLGVLSNKPDPFTKKCIDHYFPEIHFSSVAGQKPDVPRKLRSQLAVVRLELRGGFVPSKNFVVLAPNRSSRQQLNWETFC